jgi:hypothetical protein
VQADLDELLGAHRRDLANEAPATADALDDLARRFNYDQIVALTRAALAGGPS